MVLALALGFAVGSAVAFAWRRLGRGARTARPVVRPAHRASAPGTSGAMAIEADAPTAPSPPRERRALGYLCVARDAVARDLAMHSYVIAEWIAANDMRLTKIVHDIERGPRQRGPGPALHWALERIAAGDADVLVTARLEHLSPTVADLPPILAWFTGDHRTVVAIDVGLDTATEAGRLAASVLAEVGVWERKRLSARTRRGMETARARGSGRGRAAVADVPGLRERIARMREQGMTLQAIADALNEEGVATLRGGAKWRPSSVQRATGYQRPVSPLPGIDLPGPTPPGNGRDRPAPRTG